MLYFRLWWSRYATLGLMGHPSCSALGNVVNALTDAKKMDHIPYRDSKV